MSNLYSKMIYWRNFEQRQVRQQFLRNDKFRSEISLFVLRILFQYYFSSKPNQSCEQLH